MINFTRMQNRRFLVIQIVLICYSLLTTGIAQSLSTPKNRVWYVTDFGAKGDGTTMNTSFIQDAIDACSKSGGGIVSITTGNFLTGTLFLKTGVELYLDVNARLTGSGNKQDYQNVQGLAINGKPRFGDFGSFLIYAENQHHISITGKGVIDGNGAAFWEKEMLSQWVRKPKAWRPNGIVGFVNCQFIQIKELSFVNSPCYTIWPLGCDDIQIVGITIRNPIDGPNTDGIDIDCCRRVIISNCNIEGGDDAIAIKSDGGKLGKDRVCENIVVTNCILSSPPACAVRIGYEGDAPIRNCVFSNLAIYRSNHGIDIISILPDRAYPFTIFEGTRVENIQFDNIVMQTVTQPVYLWMGNEKKNTLASTYMKNIRISNLMASDAGDSYIGGSTEKSIENVFLSNISVQITRHIRQGDTFYAHVWNSKNPYGFFVNHVSGLHIDNLQVDFSAAKPGWQHAVFLNQATEVVLSKISTKNGHSIGLSSQIGVQNSSLQILNQITEPSVRFLVSDKRSSIVQ